MHDLAFPTRVGVERRSVNLTGKFRTIAFPTRVGVAGQAVLKRTFALSGNRGWLFQSLSMYILGGMFSL
jgi:hypothetical protein